LPFLAFILDSPLQHLLGNQSINCQSKHWLQVFYFQTTTRFGRKLPLSDISNKNTWRKLFVYNHETCIKKEI